MKFTHLISVSAILLAVASCMNMEIPSQIEEEASSIKGVVRDTTGTPIEYIMVTIDWGNRLEKAVTYTSSEGKFKTEIPSEIMGIESNVTLTLEDIDGKKNGGEFETLTDKVMIFQEETPEDSIVTIVLDYRMIPATPSESSPQS